MKHRKNTKVKSYYNRYWTFCIIAVVIIGLIVNGSRFGWKI